MTRPTRTAGPAAEIANDPRYNMTELVDKLDFRKLATRFHPLYEKRTLIALLLCAPSDFQYIDVLNHTRTRAIKITLDGFPFAEGLVRSSIENGRKIAFRVWLEPPHNSISLEVAT